MGVALAGVGLKWSKQEAKFIEDSNVGYHGADEFS